MNGAVNGISINGTALPSWVVRAVVVAVAAATVASSEPTRTTYAAAFGDAAVSVSLTQTHTIQARATGTANVSSSIEPTLKFAGASVATANSTGNGAVRRDVWATAGGDATCTADALTAQAIGEALATAVSTVDLAQAHLIHPGCANTLCEANAVATGDVTRYPIVLLTYGFSGPSWGEASVKRNGNSYFEHDGYSLSSSTATATVEQDKTKIIATLGSFDFGNGMSGAGSFIIYSARASGTATNTAQPVVATHIYRPTASGTATATVTADATRVVMPIATAQAESLTYGPKASIKYVATGTGTADATAVQALGVRMTMAHQGGATAGATLAEGIVFGMQHWGASDGSMAVGDSQQANAGVAFVASAQGSLAMAVTLDSTATRIQQGHVSDVLATALVGRAFALANSEIRAPDDRYMIVGQEDRAMIVFTEERLMVVTA
ncbi:hypothetical protein [Immundisolibacter sp.]